MSAASLAASVEKCFFVPYKMVPSFNWREREIHISRNRTILFLWPKFLPFSTQKWSEKNSDKSISWALFVLYQTAKNLTRECTFLFFHFSNEKNCISFFSSSNRFFCFLASVWRTYSLSWQSELAVFFLALFWQFFDGQVFFLPLWVIVTIIVPGTTGQWPSPNKEKIL